jgi:hypothetical protein
MIFAFSDLLAKVVSFFLRPSGVAFAPRQDLARHVEQDDCMSKPTASAGRHASQAPDSGGDLAARVARGKGARKLTPRANHAQFAPAPDRVDPIALLEIQGASRVQDLLPIRYGRMVSSPFAFYRGAALIMAADLATTPTTGLRAQLCGDAHLSNFGVFASAERQLVFDVNDFDETLPGPWEWDVKRFATSVEVAGRGNGFTAAECRRLVIAAVAAYRKAMSDFAANREGPGEGPDEGSPARVLEAHSPRRRRASIHQRSAPARARRGTCR